VNNGSSIYEEEIMEFIESILPDNTNIIKKDRSVLQPKELDIYIPDMNIAIEFNGLYWHSTRFLTDINYHKNKTVQCREQNIQLIHIFEDEWINKRNIVEHRLRYILKRDNSQKCHARKCIIKEIDAATKNSFLDEYHIMGSDKSVIKLGCFLNDTLISVMTFSRGNISKGKKQKHMEWELSRYCSNFGYN
jgi:hypothetical protein